MAARRASKRDREADSADHGAVAIGSGCRTGFGAAGSWTSASRTRGGSSSATGWLRRTGWRLQSKGIWAETGSRERWDNRINYLLRFARAGRRVRPTAATLCWMLPLPRTHPASIWDATPEPVLRALILQSRRRGPVLDPFCGAGTVGRVALGLGREWIGVERDPRMAELTARRLGMTRALD